MPDMKRAMLPRRLGQITKLLATIETREKVSRNKQQPVFGTVGSNQVKNVVVVDIEQMLSREINFTDILAYECERGNGRCGLHHVALGKKNKAEQTASNVKAWT